MHSLFIIGHTGNVGSQLVEQIAKYDDHRIVGLATRSGIVLKKDGIVGNDAMALINREAFTKQAKPIKETSELTNQLLTLPKETIIIDMTADSSKEMCDLHLTLIKEGFRIVTANKNPLSLFPFDAFQALTADRNRYGYNATVMAGADAVAYVQDMLAISDPLTSIQGCFSGTLGFVMSGLQDGIAFSKIVAEAHAKQYTEPHPWDDLNGLDVARKILILARTAGLPIELKDIAIEPLIPEKFGKITDVPAFLEAIKEIDADMQKRADEAKSRNTTLRFVASLMKIGSQSTLKVSLQKVPLASVIGQLKGTANVVQIITRDRAPSESPHSIISKGAGTVRTAAAIRADILKML